MAEYYAVERFPEYLMHYGVKGMRWGVQKARKLGLNTASGAKKLAEQYSKAQKKLRKLNDRANINKQNTIAKKYGKIAKISGGIGAGAALSSVGAHHLQKRNWLNEDRAVNALYNKLHPRTDGGIVHLTNNNHQNFISANKEAGDIYSKHLNIHGKLQNAKYITGGIGVAGLAVGAVTGARALAAKRHTTVGGHAAAVAKRDAWKREMDRNFSGTRFGKNGSATKLTRQIQKSAKEYLKNEGYKSSGQSNSTVHTVIPNTYSKSNVNSKKQYRQVASAGYHPKQKKRRRG